MQNMLASAYVSLITAALFTGLCVGFTGSPASLSPAQRVLLGAMHAMAHWTAALSLMVILELAMDLCTHHGFLGRTGQDGLWQTCMVAQASF